jgi:hypothetical protein
MNRELRHQFAVLSCHKSEISPEGSMRFTSIYTPDISASS